MRALFVIVTATALFVGCSGKSGSDDKDVGTTDISTEVATTDSYSPDLLIDAPPGDTPAADAVTEVAQDIPADTPAMDMEADIAPLPYIAVDDNKVDAVQPSCDGCLIIANESWDESAEPLVPNMGDYTMLPEDTGYDFTIYYKPWVRFRMPHPGKVTKLYLYTSAVSEASGAITVQLSTGFPGGHYPCLDEYTGDDKYPVGKPYQMTVSDLPGWREIDVEGAGHQVGGYDEFFVIFDQLEDARVALEYPNPKKPGDYDSYGGIIADIAEDGQPCFPSMDTFKDAKEVPLIWLVRAEVQPDYQAEKYNFKDLAAEGLNVGGHASFGDFDNDGDEDLLSGGALWQNDGAGQFENVSEAAALAGLGGETVWGDYDNDGFRDILGVGGKATLFHNEGDGTFTQVTEEIGLFIDASSQGVAWVDFNQDGFLDFYAASYGTLADSEKQTRDFLFLNNTDGTFSDVTDAMGMPTLANFDHGRGVCVADYDGDGDPDIYVGNYRLDPNQLWQNLGGMNGFDNVAVEAGVIGIFEAMSFGHTIGPSFGDLNNDGLWDLVVPNLAHPRFFDFSDPTTVYFNNGDGTFQGFETPEKGILYDETHSDSVLFDADNDGDLDLYLTSVYVGRRSQLYSNDGEGHFTDVTYDAGIKHFNGWGAAAADVDNDGDLDLVAHRLFVNQHENGNQSLQVKLTGGASPGNAAGLSNRDAIGAVVKVTASDNTWYRQVEGGTGTGCQNSSVLHFGLGALTAVDSIEVTWPSGKTTKLGSTEAGQVIEISEE